MGRAGKAGLILAAIVSGAAPPAAGQDVAPLPEDDDADVPVPEGGDPLEPDPTPVDEIPDEPPAVEEAPGEDESAEPQAPSTTTTPAPAPPAAPAPAPPAPTPPSSPVSPRSSPPGPTAHPRRAPRPRSHRVWLHPTVRAPVAVVPSRTPPPRAPAGDAYVVQAGDSLWAIARRRLGRGASAADIAREVDRLWSLNRDRIASGDPDLLRVGERLRLT